MPVSQMKIAFLLRCAAISVFLCVSFRLIGRGWARMDHEADRIVGPLVELDGLGKLIGSITYGRWTNKTIYQFLGVPYAASPKLTGRFGPPVAEKPWHGTRNAQKYGRLCPQMGELTKLSNQQRHEQDLEDCLHLSVYSCDIHRAKPTAVMVYIHGGGFYEGGSSWYPPNYLLEEDIVLVAPQFRLDALGLLSTKTKEMPGNVALLDVILALQWIQKNIRSFGGDPTRVTIFGQSSGGVMVSALAMSPAVPDNLFQRVIAQSGSALANWCYARSPVANARDIAARAGLSTNLTLAELYSHLSNLDVVTLLNATNEHNMSGFLDGITSVGGRGLTYGDPANILPASGYDMKRSGQYRKNLSVMTGTTKHDGSYVAELLYNILSLKNLTNDADFITYDLIDFVLEIFLENDDGGGLAALANDVHWTQDEINSGDFRKIAPGLIDLAGVLAFKAPALRLATAYARYNPSNTYLYTFDYVGEHTRFGYGKPTDHLPFDGGVSHSNDYIYLFPYPESVATLNAADTEMAKKVVHLWTSFAIHGRPELIGANGDGVQWQPVEKYGGPYLHIDKEWRLGSNFLDEFSVSSKQSRRK